MGLISQDGVRQEHLMAFIIRVRCRVYNLGGGYLYYFGSILSPEDTVIDS